MFFFFENGDSDVASHVCATTAERQELRTSVCCSLKSESGRSLDISELSKPDPIRSPGVIMTQIRKLSSHQPAEPGSDLIIIDIICIFLAKFRKIVFCYFCSSDLGRCVSPRKSKDPQHGWRVLQHHVEAFQSGCISDQIRSEQIRSEQIRSWTLIIGPRPSDGKHKQTAAEVGHLRSLVYTNPTHVCTALTQHTTPRLYVRRR